MSTGIEWVQSKPNKKENPQFHKGQDGLMGKRGGDEEH